MVAAHHAVVSAEVATVVQVPATPGTGASRRGCPGASPGRVLVVTMMVSWGALFPQAQNE